MEKKYCIDEYIIQANKKVHKINKDEIILDEKFQLEEIIGRGAYGCVVSAIDLTEQDTENNRVAIKKIENIFEHSIFSKRCLRELIISRLLQQYNIVQIKEVLIPDREDFEDIYVVYELMETDLGAILKSNQSLSDEHIQYFLYQILRGLKFIHSANIIHRDLKPKNLLVNSSCELKICDFGLSRPIIDDLSEKKNVFTEYIATRWYRAPEVLLNWNKYSKAVDMWSVGCIFAELLGRNPIFPGDDISQQIELIVDLIGTPSVDEIYEISTAKSRELVFNFGQKEPRNLEEVFPEASPEALDLLSKMLVFNPLNRITVEEALEHPYLSTLHLPEDEPVSDPVSKFDFLFEDLEEVSIEKMKELIISEILLYVDPDHYENYVMNKKKWTEMNGN